MTILNSVSQQDLQHILSHLDQGVFSHQQWLHSLIRSLVCHIPGDTTDTLPDAHARCAFGKWYYNDAPALIQHHQGFVNIGQSHQKMHDFARGLIQKNSAMESITPMEYDYFSNAFDHWRIEISNLKCELEYANFNRDPLTGCINRISLPVTLREEQEMIKRLKKNCFLAIIDMDELKNVNEQYGHQAGDIVLGEVGRLVVKMLRPYDKVYRYGGDEFLLCLPFTELDDGLKIIERLRNKIETTTINVDDLTSIYITVSMGAVMLDPELSIEEIIEHADKAMYAAKKEGGNCVRFWNASKTAKKN